MIPIERRDAAVGCWRSPADLKAAPHGESRPEQYDLWPASNQPAKNEVWYISGPVTNKDPKKQKANQQVFIVAEHMMLAAGCQIFNPAHIEGPIDPLQGDAMWQYYMHFCVRALPECDAILMLPDWQNSKGAVWEHKIAEMLGMRVAYSPVLE